MSVLEIRKYGDEILRKKAEEVKDINGNLIELARAMVETMHQAPGLGLAAPQVGHSLQLITVDLSVGENPGELIVMINPRIVEKEGSLVDEEGCLSIPGFYEKVKRPKRVLVKGYDLEGKEIEIEAEDLLARVLCHEVDHLEGRLFIDLLSPLKRSFIKREIKKKIKAGEW